MPPTNGRALQFPDHTQEKTWLKKLNNWAKKSENSIHCQTVEKLSDPNEYKLRRLMLRTDLSLIEPFSFPNVLSTRTH